MMLPPDRQQCICKLLPITTIFLLPPLSPIFLEPSRDPSASRLTTILFVFLSLSSVSPPL